MNRKIIRALINQLHYRVVGNQSTLLTVFESTCYGVLQKHASEGELEEVYSFFYDLAAWLDMERVFVHQSIQELINSVQKAKYKNNDFLFTIVDDLTTLDYAFVKLEKTITILFNELSSKRLLEERVEKSLLLHKQQIGSARSWISLLTGPDMG